MIAPAASKINRAHMPVSWHEEERTCIDVELSWPGCRILFLDITITQRDLFGSVLYDAAIVGGPKPCFNSVRISPQNF
jgi:hypothetical protein